jgi:1-acyl-sn-glycerol-3-phosphate acyltransferase
LREGTFPHVRIGGKVYARAFLLALLFAGTFAFIAPVQAVLRRLNSPAACGVQLRFCRLICAILGIRITRNGVKPDGGPHLIVANHVSWTDIIALASVFPLTFLAKSEVANWPLLGSLARLQGTIFIERGDRQQLASVNATIADCLRRGSSLVVFPEGTSTHGVIEPKFNSSHFQAAHLGEVPILPVSIFYADEAGQADVGWYGDMTFMPHLWRLLKKDGFSCHISIGTLIKAAGKDRKSLALEAQSQVRVLLNEALERRSAPGKCSL